MRTARPLFLIALTSLALAGGCVEPKSDVISGAAVTPVTPPVTGVTPTPVEPSPTEPTPLEPAAGGFEVHEWGTYTSLANAAGDTMIGLHHEEEPLPPFVERRCLGCEPKAMEQLPEPVTQKLETPVLYFYSASLRRVTVDVRFPDGLISEYYPAPAAFSPPLGEAFALADGAMRWEVTVDPAIAPASFPEVPDDDLWAPSRRTSATPLRVGDATERFIFYRGLGRFTVPFRVTALAEGALVLANGSDAPITAAFVLNVAPWGATIGPAVALGAHSEVAVPIPAAPIERPGDFAPAATEALHEALVTSGLTADEATAMLDTWDRSYFHTPGVRVLYVAPRAWTDAILPITISPVPDKLVRTLVGRVEVTPLATELALIEELRTLQAKGTGAYAAVEALFPAHGRLVEARVRAARRHIQDQALAYYAALVIQNASGPFFNLASPPEP